MLFEMLLFEKSWRLTNQNHKKFFEWVAFGFEQNVVVGQQQHVAYTDLAKNLECVISRDQELVADVAPILVDLLYEKAATIKDSAMSNDITKRAVAYFLTECLRCINSATHSKKHIVNIRALATECNIPVRGDVNECIRDATFGVLKYVSDPLSIYFGKP